MNLCSDGHDEVCYETRRCPACELKELVSEKDDSITELKARVVELENSDE